MLLSLLSIHLFDEPISLLPQVELLILEILIFEDMTCPWRLVAACQAALDVVGRPELCGGAGGWGGGGFWGGGNTDCMRMRWRVVCRSRTLYTPRIRTSSDPGLAARCAV